MVSTRSKIDVRFALGMLTAVFNFALNVGCSQVHTGARDVAGQTDQALTVTTFQGSPRASWLTDKAGRARTASRTLHLTGECERGIYAVQPRLASNQSLLGDPTLCQPNGTFEWIWTAVVDGEFRVTLEPRDRENRTAGASVTVSLLVDSTPPSPPEITTNRGADFVSGTALITLQGTVPTDAVEIKFVGGGRLNYRAGSPTFDHQLELNPGETRTVAFTALDEMGNESEPRSISISYLPNLRLSLLSFSGMESGSVAQASDHGTYQIRNVSLLPMSAGLGVAYSDSNHLMLSMENTRVAAE